VTRAEGLEAVCGCLAMRVDARADPGIEFDHALVSTVDERQGPQHFSRVLGFRLSGWHPDTPAMGWRFQKANRDRMIVDYGTI
jgi:hypothetical protein